MMDFWMFIKIEQGWVAQVLHCSIVETKMKSFQQVVTLLRTRHSVLISAEKEAFLKALFQAYFRAQEIHLQKHLTFAFDERQCQVIISVFNKSLSPQQQPSKSDPIDGSPPFKRKYSQLQETPKKRQNSSTEPNSPVRPQKIKESAKTESSTRSQELSSANLKFFPFCDRTDSCQFYHPTVKCNDFPKCREGSACMYIHEPCRFDEKCTRVDCSYDHRYRPKHLDGINALLKASKLFLSSKRTEMVDSFEDYSD